MRVGSQKAARRHRNEDEVQRREATAKERGDPSELKSGMGGRRCRRRRNAGRCRSAAGARRGSGRCGRGAEHERTRHRPKNKEGTGMTGQGRAVQKRRGGDGNGAYRRRLFIPCGPGFGRRTFRKRGFFRVEPERGARLAPPGWRPGKIGAARRLRATPSRHGSVHVGSSGAARSSAPQRAVVDGRIIFG